MSFGFSDRTVSSRSQSGGKQIYLEYLETIFYASHGGRLLAPAPGGWRLPALRRLFWIPPNCDESGRWNATAATAALLLLLTGADITNNTTSPHEMLYLATGLGIR